MSEDYTFRPVDKPPMPQSKYRDIHLWLQDHPDEWLEVEVPIDNFNALKNSLGAKGYEVRERRIRGETPKVYARRLVKKKKGQE